MSEQNENPTKTFVAGMEDTLKSPTGKGAVVFTMPGMGAITLTTKAAEMAGKRLREVQDINEAIRRASEGEVTLVDIFGIEKGAEALEALKKSGDFKDGGKVVVLIKGGQYDQEAVNALVNSSIDSGMTFKVMGSPDNLPPVMIPSKSLPESLTEGLISRFTTFKLDEIRRKPDGEQAEPSSNHQKL